MIFSLRSFTLSFCALAALCFTAPTTHAALLIFSGVDPGAGPGDPRPNSDTAAAAFDAAAATVGTGVASLLDFESAPLGFFSSLTSAQLGVPGVSIDPAAASDGDDTEIANLNTISSGYNTTAGGSRYLHFIEQGPGEPPIGTTFAFDPGIAAFGGYFTGIQAGLPGVVIVTFDNGLVQQFALDATNSPGVQFFGFVDNEPGLMIDKVTVSVVPEFPSGVAENTDEFGIDDVRFVPAIPEPSSLVLLSAAAAFAVGIRRRAS